MSTVLSTPPTIPTLADLLEELGDVPANRVLLRPPPGTATERDLLDLLDHENRLCELVDGVLVEKAMGFRESILAVALIRFLSTFVNQRQLGLVTAPDGTMRLAPRLVRMPDVAFTSWDRFPNRQVPREPIPSLAPDLAVEILSKGNRPREMARKCREYFAAGTRLVWIIDPVARTAEVFTAPEQSAVLTEADTLDGGDVLPGFSLRLRDLFAELEAPPAP